jgi:hypothetical protein|tara:strand:- start:438 stop:734 length:297 start_codon:yes stop_codon:yes gene_type:complete
MSQKLNLLIDQALDNINQDRQETENLLMSLKEYMQKSPERYSDSGPIAAKFVETLQRSNEQLVKIAALVYKKDFSTQSNSLSEDDKKNLFDIINQSEE